MSLTQYIEKNQTACFAKHGVIFAFSKKQFEEQKEGDQTYVDLGSGLLCPKPNVDEFINDHSSIVKNGMARDLKENGKNKIILRELGNYECFYTGNIKDAVDALEDYGFTVQDIKQVYNDNYARLAESW